GGSLATALALTESLTASGPGRYPSALITTNSIFDFSPLAIASLHPSHSAGISSLAGPGGMGIRELFPNPPSTLDPLASPLLLFRGSSFHPPAFAGSWDPSPKPRGVFEMDSDSDLDVTHAISELDVTASETRRAEETARDEPPPSAPNAAAVAEADFDPSFDPTYPQKRSYLKFPPAHSGLRLPACNFQISHPLPPQPQKASRASKASRSAATGLESAPDAPLEVVQAQLMASAINRSVRMGYDSPARRGGEEGEEERAVVSELAGEGDVEERGAVGAREWLRETMDWR
ncbi:hypothetical protein V496_10238, partial [Pseudogymnoascus sp. VKM F-4515 (FW-2607)]